jgi:hypothetical protein
VQSVQSIHPPKTPAEHSVNGPTTGSDNATGVAGAGAGAGAGHVDPDHSKLNSNYLHFYASCDGDVVFLHPICNKCLLVAANNDITALPAVLTAPVIEVERLKLSATLKQRIPFLRHLPEHSDIAFVEIDMKHIVPGDVLSRFQEELAKRAKKRKERAQMAKKEKKMDIDQM